MMTVERQNPPGALPARPFTKGRRGQTGTGRKERKYQEEADRKAREEFTLSVQRANVITSGAGNFPRTKNITRRSTNLIGL